MRRRPVLSSRQTWGDRRSRGLLVSQPPGHLPLQERAHWLCGHVNSGAPGSSLYTAGQSDVTCHMEGLRCAMALSRPWQRSVSTGHLVRLLPKVFLQTDQLGKRSPGKGSGPQVRAACQHQGATPSSASAGLERAGQHHRRAGASSTPTWPSPPQTVLAGQVLVQGQVPFHQPWGQGPRP